MNLASAPVELPARLAMSFCFLRRSSQRPSIKLVKPSRTISSRLRSIRSDRRRAARDTPRACPFNASASRATAAAASLFRVLPTVLVVFGALAEARSTAPLDLLDSRNAHDLTEATTRKTSCFQFQIAFPTSRASLARFSAWRANTLASTSSCRAFSRTSFSSARNRSCAPLTQLRRRSLCSLTSPSQSAFPRFGASESPSVSVHPSQNLTSGEEPLVPESRTGFRQDFT